MLWKAGGAPAGGALFHRAVEAFNARAGREPRVIDAIGRAQSPQQIHEGLGRWFGERFLDPALTARPVWFRQGFEALNLYMEVLADVAFYAKSNGISVAEIVAQLFTDARKRVDVTFDLGGQHKVRVTGAIDYIFYDWRTRRHRIFDYKLTPSHAPNGDLLQVATYALMHDRQHGTRPDAAVYYLHPKRSLNELSWEQISHDRGLIYDHLASMIAWEEFDPDAGVGMRPPGVASLCGGCPWSGLCEGQLGSKEQGEHVTTWSALARAGGPEPIVVVTDPPKNAAEAELEEGGATPEADEPTGLVVGLSAHGPHRVVVPTRALNTHVAVVGAAGSGKTWTAKVIAEEAVRNGVPVIAIDPQGDLVRFLTRRDPAVVPPDLRPLYDEFAARVEPRVYTPGTSHARRLSLDPIRLPRAEDLAGIENAARRAEEEDALLQGLAVNLASLAATGGDRSAQETFLLQILRGLPRGEPVALGDLVRYVRDPERVGIDDRELFIKAAARTNLALKLNTLVYGPTASLFGGGESLSIDALVRPSRAGRVPLNVIYLNAMANEDQKQFFIASLASELYRWMITGPSAEGGRTNVLFYLDEARDYIPAGASRPMAKDPLLRLFRQGRKYGVGCLICTQSPRSVDYNAFGNCSSKVIGRLESAQDVERVREWFTTEAAPAWLAGRKEAEPGSFVARWATDTASGGAPFRGRMLFSTHEGAWSPDRVEAEAHADVDDP